MTSKKYFTTREIIERFIEEAYEHEQDAQPLQVEIVNTVSNSDYYIVYYSEAEKALDEFGVWKALDVVSNFELNEFGQIYTDISDPTNVANALWFVLVEEFASEFHLESYNTMGELIEELEKELEALED